MRLNSIPDNCGGRFKKVQGKKYQKQNPYPHNNHAPTSATYILPKPFPLPALVDVLANDTSPLINTDPHTVTMV